ncbi:hypothetical protein DPMN_178135 [Dreissena polymorpha]|uniref:Uncharacterized protein n=1 Tax=Dreissena polymorpha TaxID=45954 RepID=A0A9D4IMB2_DREPO|nr:hypothetical protein DPMN_178135 [Dreissena polymorpha]
MSVRLSVRMSVYPTEGQTVRKTDGYTKVGRGGHADGKTDARTVGNKDTRAHEQMGIMTYGRTDRQRDIQKCRQTDKQTRLTNRRTNGN